MQPRYANGIYRDCKWCQGAGCVCCPEEADAEYKRQFPEGPKPIATFKTDNPQDMENMKQVFGVDALTKAFGPGGKGLEEIIENCKAI